jgi:hypothetical protein
MLVMKLQTLTMATLAGVIVGGALVTAQAAPVTFSGIDNNGNANVALATTPNSDAARNNFFTNLVGVGTETFETQTVGNTSPLPINFGAAGTATLLGGGIVASVTPGTTNGFGRSRVPSASSSHYWEVSAGGAGNFSVGFSAPISAFGFYGIDIGDFAGTLTLELTDTLNNVTNLAVPAAAINVADGSVLYFGFYDLSTQYTSIAFQTTTGTGDTFAFDNFSIGSFDQVVPAPEPVSIAVLGTGLLGLRFVRRRRS